MAKRQKEWAKRTRDRLFDLLGRKCQHCGATEELEFDVIVAHNNDHHRKYDWSQRMTFYKRQYEANNLQVLCTKCNSRKGDDLVLNIQLTTDQPF